MKDLYTYDIETYPNTFTLRSTHVASRTDYSFEISDRVDMSKELLAWLRFLADNNCAMVGFNNIGFDYPVIHFFMQGAKSAQLLYQKAMTIIQSDDRFANVIWDRDQFIPQIDLFKIHHFDNKARMTSLKQLEFAMRMWSIQDLPFPVGTILDDEQKDVLLHYNGHDDKATGDFLSESMDALELRQNLSEKYGHDFTNYNDTKIGKQYFVMQLEEAGVSCFEQRDGRKKPRQTPRPTGIPLSNIIFPCVSFTRPEFCFVLDWLKSHVVHDTRESFLVDSTCTLTVDELKAQGMTATAAKKVLKPTPLSATLYDFRFDFGCGGLHGSIESTLVTADEQFAIIDLDVTSYYPSIAIDHRVFPEHLSERFCDIYEDVKQQRLTFAKGTPENAVMKLALNGVYGDSNNQYSPFYDPQYTMTITINGQLMLAMLAEALLEIPNLSMVQANTDGVTVRLPRVWLGKLDLICKMWEGRTSMALERVEYSRMWIRDVNNYVAETADTGKLKQKGAYVTDRGWHQNHGELVVPKVAVKYLSEGGDIDEMIRTHTDMFDFMIKAKVRRSDHLMWGDAEVQSFTRYYVTTEGNGAPLAKYMPLTDNQVVQVENKLAQIHEKIEAGRKYDPDELLKKQEELRTRKRKTSICAGHTVQVCNTMDHATAPINFEYYANQVRDLVACFNLETAEV